MEVPFEVKLEEKPCRKESFDGKWHGGPLTAKWSLSMTKPNCWHSLSFQHLFMLTKYHIPTPCLSKVWQTIYQWNPCLDHFLFGHWHGQKNKCSRRALTWVQTLSGIKSSRKNILSAEFQIQELSKLFWPGLKLKI